MTAIHEWHVNSAQHRRARSVSNELFNFLSILFGLVEPLPSIKDRWSLLGAGVQHISTWLLTQDTVQKNGVLRHSSSSCSHG